MSEGCCKEGTIGYVVSSERERLWTEVIYSYINRGDNPDVDTAIKNANKVLEAFDKKFSN